MRVRAIARGLRQAGAVAVCVVLLACAVPAYADTTTATVAPTTPTTTQTTPKTTTKTTSTPKKTSTTSSTTKTTNTPSAIQTPVDKSTEAFRKELAAKQARVAAFNTELDALDTQLEIASQQYDEAADQLNQVKNQVQVATSDLTKARSAFDTQNEILGERASSLYKDGSLGAMEVLLDSKSLPDFVARVKFLNTIGLADADIAASLKAQRDLMEQQVADLKNAQTTAQSLEFEQKARQIEVMLRIQEREQMMASAQSDLMALLDKQAAGRQAEESQLLAQVLSGANKLGIVVEPGSPVETALAYHGVPYLWGGATPAGFDCSGLVMYVFAQHGVALPHYSGAQFQLGTPVPLDQLQPNDVVFFGFPVHHVGIYMGGGYFIEAPHTGDFVKIAKLSDWNGQIAGARRYNWQFRVGPPLNGVSSTSQALKHVP